MLVFKDAHIMYMYTLYVVHIQMYTESQGSCMKVPRLYLLEPIPNMNGTSNIATIPQQSNTHQCTVYVYMYPRQLPWVFFVFLFQLAY